MDDPDDMLDNAQSSCNECAAKEAEEKWKTKPFKKSEQTKKEG